MTILRTLGLLCDLLWSDPDREIIGWGENDRGVSFTFGEDIVKDFLSKHDLDLVCRAHQVGYGYLKCYVWASHGLEWGLRAEINILGSWDEKCFQSRRINHMPFISRCTSSKRVRFCENVCKVFTF